MISYSARKPKLVAQKVNPQVHLSWKDKLLLFHSERIGSILERLAQSHGLQTEVRHESLQQELFTGSVPGDPAALILDKIKQLYRVNIREEKRRLTLNRLGLLYDRTSRYCNGHPTAANYGMDLAPHNNLFPIPFSEIERNTTAVLEQNPGYSGK
jgi:hypothetical protein